MNLNYSLQTAPDADTLCHKIGLDLKMTIERSYLEACMLINSMLKHVFCSIQHNHADLLMYVKHEDLMFPDETVALQFADGVKLLKESGWTEVDRKEMDEYEDLSRRAEVRLGQSVKEKYNMDYYILGAHLFCLLCSL